MRLTQRKAAGLQMPSYADGVIDVPVELKEQLSAGT